MKSFKTIATAVAFTFAAVSATSVMANTQMHCMNDQGHKMANVTSKAECEKMHGKMMTEKEMVQHQDKMKEDKMKQDNKMKEDKMMKDDKMAEEKMMKDDKMKEDKMK